ncbi:hypothetical protein [Streptomyces sp. NPDC001781]
MSETLMTPERRSTIESLLGGAKPATTVLVQQMAKAVQDRAAHEHPTWEDLYCLNLVSWMGERTAPVLRRLLDAESQAERYRTAWRTARTRALALGGAADRAGERARAGQAALQDMLEALLTRQIERDAALKRVAELEAQRERRRVRLVAAEADLLEMRGLLSPNGQPRRIPTEVEIHERVSPAVEWLLRRVAELEVAPATVYRAEHPDSGITLGHYGTEAAARAHCEAEERRAWSSSSVLRFDWIEDDEDRVAELVVTAGQNEESTTGYIVTALELASEYDEEADA